MAATVQTNITKLQKLTKYILMGLIVIFSIRFIPNICLKNEEIIMIGAISSITFALLDIISPSIRIKTAPVDNKKTVVEGGIATSGAKKA